MSWLAVHWQTLVFYGGIEFWILYKLTKLAKSQPFLHPILQEEQPT